MFTVTKCIERNFAIGEISLTYVHKMGITLCTFLTKQIVLGRSCTYICRIQYWAILHFSHQG
jgi:hypothetical protein